MPKRDQSDGVSLKERLAQKRLKNATSKDENCYNVQLLAAEPSGLNQKYKRIGALEYISISGAPTVSKLKAACLETFSADTKICDILVSERGPSVKSLGQIDLKKVIHCRIFDMDNDVKKKKIEEDIEKEEEKAEQVQEEDKLDESEKVEDRKSPERKTAPQSIVKSVSFSAYMKAGQAIKSDKRIVM